MMNIVSEVYNKIINSMNLYKDTATFNGLHGYIPITTATYSINAAQKSTILKSWILH